MTSTKPMSNEPNYDDPKVEEEWCEERREEVFEYLAAQGVEHGRVGEWPAWHVAPCASVWAIESKSHPEQVGWWVVCGDCPADYVSSSSSHTPREALHEIGTRWLDVVDHLARGKQHPDVQIGSPEHARELAPLLKSRAETLLEWSADDSLWEEE